MRLLCKSLVAGMIFAIMPVLFAAEAEYPLLPERLADTGLYVQGAAKVADGVLEFSPQYPLWSDAASKRRWILLPPGTSIDASNPDAWEFPAGTRLWKQFGYERPVETRYMERLPDGGWRFATYIWKQDGSDAVLASERGARIPAAGAPGGRYEIPSREDCLACHEAALVPVLGFSTLQLSESQLSESQDALRVLAEKGLVKNLPQALLDTPPRIPALSDRERAVLGYLHGNCGHCHNDDGPLAALDLNLQQSAVASKESLARTLESLIGKTGDFRLHGVDTRVVPGARESSLLLARMQSRNPAVQMPPLGTRVSDAEAVALVAQWIQFDLQSSRVESP